MKRLTALCLVFFLCSSICFSQDLTWYKFDKTFINAHYSDSAIGSISFNSFHPALNVHETICGGKDGELHIGMRLPEVDLPSAQMPLTGPPGNSDPNWGLVAELPNADLGNGPAKLGDLDGGPVTFQGYFRVWDEGHGAGATPPSNPHHVFEIHPAWGFNGEGVNFSRKNLVVAMSGYRGYGATKFRGMFKDFRDEVWPLAFQNASTLFLGLEKNANFYQLPIRVKSRKTISGGHEVTVQVFSNKEMTNEVFPELTAITVTGSPIDSALPIGKKTFLLGFFSVNLKKALDASTGANSEANAVSVNDALEFFVFGIAVKPAVKSCS